MRLPAICSVAIVVSYAGIYFLQSRIDEAFGEFRATEEILYVNDGKLLKTALIGFENIAADLYWLRTVQYFGGKRRDVTNKDYRLLEPLLAIATDLDPNFKIAYTYGATFLSEPFPVGAGVPLQGIELVDKGIANNPDYWRFYLDKGFIYFWYLEDYKKAAEIFLEGSKLPGAPYWMVATAGRTLTTGGDRQTARELWTFLYESAETDQQRENARIHLAQLDALDQIDVLEQIVAEYRETTGRDPGSWTELLAAGYLKRVPVDPSGTVYELDAATHEVRLSRNSGLGRLPTR